MTRWLLEAARAAARQPKAWLPVISGDETAPIVAGFDLWDMWQIMRADGSSLAADGRTWWFFLAAPRGEDPDARHDAARIRLTSFGPDGWRDHGWTFPEGFTPGSREWSGSAVLDASGEKLTMYFTAAGRRGVPHTFEQRLFEAQAPFQLDGGVPQFGVWTDPVEVVAADGAHYTRANQHTPTIHGIKGFRDPGYFCDPVSGAQFLLFTGSSGGLDDVDDGVIGFAERIDGAWHLRPPLIDAKGVNSELERPHIVFRNRLYYVFWTTQARRFAPGIGAPTGLYGMVADSISGSWRPLNDTGLVAANPPIAPFQAYCWWVTAEDDVISFVDYRGVSGPNLPETAKARRAAFGGTAAPWFRLVYDRDRVTIA